MADSAAFITTVFKVFESTKDIIASKKYPEVRSIRMIPEITDGTIVLHFIDGDINLALTIPIPFKDEKGIEYLNDNEILRPTCKYFIKEDFCALGFLGMMYFLLTRNLQTISKVYPSKTPFIDRIIYSFPQKSPAWTVGNCQGLIDSFVHRLPLSETDMNNWAVNNRIEILDPEFIDVGNPTFKLEYQVKKNEDFWEAFGWSSMGLAESALAEKNYLLMQDLRKTIPFGKKHHYWQRNLYQTLGMKGPEGPTITTESAEKLEERGIKRGGKMLFTAFLDLPFNFEDHIIADYKLTDLANIHTRRYSCFGEIQVKIGQRLKHGDILAINPDGEVVKFAVPCDAAEVEDIIARRVNIGGEEAKAFLVKVLIKRNLKDGTKLTNLHGNKGIASFRKDIGFAIDPRTGKKVPIEILASASSIRRRKNFGQILEACATAICGKNNKIVLSDDAQTTEAKVAEALKNSGLPQDGTWEIETKWGKYRAVCGWVFWGVIKDPEDQLWSEKDTKVKDGRGRRRAGLKFSNIEIRALITQFGPKNPVVNEILSYFQGSEDLRQMIMILNCCRNTFPKSIELDAANVNPVNTQKSLLQTAADLKATIVDENFHPHGFIMKLPVKFHMLVHKNPLEGIGWATDKDLNDRRKAGDKIFVVDKVWVPYSNLRKSWRHATGKFGLSQIGGFINRLIAACHTGDEEAILNSLTRYLNGVAKILSTKTGEVAQFGMAVRYPNSVKATAVLGENLPRNTLEIHRNMAKDLAVRSGDIVIAERFPCLGFMSIRPQKIRVTDDPACKYVIRVSGNSLVSQNLDFDGDVLYLASFHNPDSKMCLSKAFETPNEICAQIVNEINERKKPQTKQFALADYSIIHFDDMTAEEHSLAIRRAVGVKSHTGPVIALCYNLMRIVESEVGYENTLVNAMVEKMLDQLGNTVFSQKHGITPLHELTIEAVCKADVEALVKAGFDRQPSELICAIVRKKAVQLGIDDLEEHYLKAKVEGRSNIINTIVRRMNRIYFASRASLSPYWLLENLRTAPNDLPSHLLAKALLTRRGEVEEELRVIKVDADVSFKKKRFDEIWKAAREGTKPTLKDVWPSIKAEETNASKK